MDRKTNLLLYKIFTGVKLFLLIFIISLLSPLEIQAASDLKCSSFWISSIGESKYAAGSDYYPIFRKITPIVNKLQVLYPPEHSIYIGLGRSPTPVMAYLKALGNNNIYNLPLSKFRYHPDKTEASVEIDQGSFFKIQLPPDIEANLFLHFSQFLPAPETINNKNLILIDFVQSGTSLFAAQKYIQKYYDQLGYQIEVIPLPIVGQMAQKQRQPEMSLYPWLEIDRILLIEFAKSNFDQLSQFDGYLVDKEFDKQFEENKKYNMLVKEYQKMLGIKTGFRRFLPFF